MSALLYIVAVLTSRAPNSELLWHYCKHPCCFAAWFIINPFLAHCVTLAENTPPFFFASAKIVQSASFHQYSKASQSLPLKAIPRLQPPPPTSHIIWQKGYPLLLPELLKCLQTTLLFSRKRIPDHVCHYLFKNRISAGLSPDPSLFLL